MHELRVALQRLIPFAHPMCVVRIYLRPRLYNQQGLNHAIYTHLLPSVQSTVAVTLYRIGSEFFGSGESCCARPIESRILPELLSASIEIGAWSCSLPGVAFH